jgi:hypothetical protein
VYPKQWADRQTTKVVFQPDNCQLDSKDEKTVRKLNCNILGKNSLNLPKEVDIRAGTFILEYTEGKLIRTITFRIPASAKSEIGSIVVD